VELDLDLIKRVREHDGEAFDMLFARYCVSVRLHLQRIVRDAGIADDLTQEVFLRLWTRAEQWEGRGALAGWLLRIGTNLALNHLRSQRRHPQGHPRRHSTGMTEADTQPGPAEDVEDASAVEPGEALDRSEQGERLRELVAGLPDQKREILRLVYQEQMGLQQVAAILGIPPGTVKSRLHHARAELAKQWGEASNELEE
jgi:RNA polymerase sigma-70 factor (ECF subfamily)